MSKSNLIRKLIEEENWKESFKIAKTFRINITKEQHSIITRAYECIVHPGFYLSIGKDIQECIELGKQTLKEIV